MNFNPSFQDKDVMQSNHRISVIAKWNPAKWGCSVLLSACLLFSEGCSSSGFGKPNVEGVSFVDVDGTALKTPPTSLTVGQGTYVDVMMSNDSGLLGADWSVVCGSAPPPGTPLPPGQTQDQSCGTFTPAHTLGAPIPSYVADPKGYLALYVAPQATPKQGVVTLVASATADHSRISTVTLTIEGEPIVVSFAPAPPSSLQVRASAQFRAVLSNDVTDAGVRWSSICGAADCGFFGPVESVSGVATTYVAPAVIPPGGSVQIVATSVADPTKTVSQTVSITP